MMNSGDWVGDLLAEREREAANSRVQAEQELLRHKKFEALTPIIWKEIEGSLRTAVDCFNRRARTRLAVKPLRGSFSILIEVEGNPYQAFGVYLNVESGVLRYGQPITPQYERTLIIKIDHESHWSVEEPRTRTNVPFDRIDEFVLRDFLNSLPL